MWSDSNFVFALIAVTAALMASNKARFDIVALMVVLALVLSGVLTVGETLAGFGSSVVMLVACLLVVEMLDRTGVAAAIGDWILKKGGSNETRLYRPPRRCRSPVLTQLDRQDGLQPEVALPGCHYPCDIQPRRLRQAQESVDGAPDLLPRMRGLFIACDLSE